MHIECRDLPLPDQTSQTTTKMCQWNLSWLRSHLGYLEFSEVRSTTCLSNPSEYYWTEQRPIRGTVLMTHAEMYAQHRFTNFLNVNHASLTPHYFLNYFRFSVSVKKNINQTLHVWVLTMNIIRLCYTGFLCLPHIHNINGNLTHRCACLPVSG